MAAATAQEKTLVVTTSMTPSISFDSTPTSGNILFATLMSQGDATPITAPTGWTLSRSGNTAANCTIATAYKVSAGTEGAVQWTKTTSNHNTLWIAEVSGLTGSTPTGEGVTTVGTSVTAIQAIADASVDSGDYAIAFAGSQAATNVEAGRAWTNSYTESTAGGTGTTRPLIVAATKVLDATAIPESTFSTTGSGDQMCAAIITWAVGVASAAINSVGGDDVVLDAEQNVSFVTSGFSGEISTVQLVSGTSITTINPVSINSTGGSGDFDLIDISALTSPTVGAPLTTANNIVVARLTDA